MEESILILTAHNQLIIGSLSIEHEAVADKNMQKSLGNMRNLERQKHREPSRQITERLTLLLRVPQRWLVFLPFSKNSDLRFKFFKDMGSDSI